MSAVWGPKNMQIVVIGDPQMTFRGIWSPPKGGGGAFSAAFGIFGTKNMLILIIGDPQMTFWGIWDQNELLQFLVLKIYANVDHWRPPNDILGQAPISAVFGILGSKNMQMFVLETLGY